MLHLLLLFKLQKTLKSALILLELFKISPGLLLLIEDLVVSQTFKRLILLNLGYSWLVVKQLAFKVSQSIFFAALLVFFVL